MIENGNGRRSKNKERFGRNEQVRLRRIRQRKQETWQPSWRCEI